MSELHDRTSDEVLAAASIDNLIPSGTYIGKVTKVLPRKNDDDADFDAGRELATLATDLHDPDTGERVGNVFIRVSWEPRFTAQGRLDSTATRYTQLMKALDMKRGSVADVLKAAQTRAFKVRVQESYQVQPEDLHASQNDTRVGRDGMAWVAVRPEQRELREYYISLGYDPRVQVRGLQAIR